MIFHKKNTAYYLSFPMVDSVAPESFKSGVSPVDTAYYKDGAGAWTSLAITDTATEIGSTGVYEIDLTAAEMNHDLIVIKFSVVGAADTAFLFNMLNNSYIVSDTTADMDANSTKLASIETDTQDLQAQIGTAGAGLTNLGGMSTAMKAEVNAEADTAIADAGLATANALAIVDGLIDAIKAVTDLLPNAGALTDLASAADLATVDANVDSILTDTGTSIPALIAALNNISVTDILTTQMTESYAAPTAAPSIAQALFMIQQFLTEFTITNTTYTVKKLDGSTVAATYELDDLSPTGNTRDT